MSKGPKKSTPEKLPSFEAVVDGVVNTYEVVFPQTNVPGMGVFTAAQIAMEENAEVADLLITIGSGALKLVGTRDLTEEEKGMVEGDAEEVVSMEQHNAVVQELEALKVTHSESVAQHANALGDKDGKISSLNSDVSERDAKIVSLNAAIDSLQGQPKAPVKPATKKKVTPKTK